MSTPACTHALFDKKGSKTKAFIDKELVILLLVSIDLLNISRYREWTNPPGLECILAQAEKCIIRRVELSTVKDTLKQCKRL